jgi:outer membrane receptor for ferrienterochelin and colicin
MFMGGVRYDHNSLYGSLFTPRFHVKYALSDHLALRGTVGKGFRSPQILSEYNYFLAGNRSIVIASPPRMEEAWNYGISATYDLDLAGKEIMINGEWYYTNFLHQTIADMDSRPHQVIFDQMNGKSFSHSAQVEVSSEIVTGLTLNLAHRINIVKQTIGGVLRDKPLTSRLKSLLGLSYQTPRKQWQFDYTAQLNGGGRMPDPDVQTPLWKRDFAPFTIMNAQVTKYFKKWSLYAGSENLTNFVQKNPIVEASDPDSPDFDASMVWGPIHGRKFYVGLRFAL